MEDHDIQAEYADLVRVIRSVVERTLEAARDFRLLFVTNVRTGEFIDLGPDGVMNSAQYYTQLQADAMIRSFQDIGMTVEAYFSELELFHALANEDPACDPRQRIVYSTAEGGTGSGRRALIPALCSMMRVPALNCGAHASSMVRHKFHAYAVLRHAGVRIPDTWQFWEGRWSGGSCPPRGARVIVKPTYESMGIGVDEDSVQIVDAGIDTFVAEKTRKFAQPAVVQEFVSGEEVGVPVAKIGATYALPPIAQRRADGQQYGQRPKTFGDEFLRHDLSHAPFKPGAVASEALRNAAVLAFDALDMKGVGRIDFRIDSDGRAWVIDTNGEPPPLEKTCWSAAMDLLGFPLNDLLALWVGICLDEHELISGIGPKGQLAAGH
jgi:D-alanine-D-alanine ligase